MKNTRQTYAGQRKKYIDSLLRLQDPGSQCEYLLMLGMEKPPLDSLRADQYRIGDAGPQSGSGQRTVMEWYIFTVTVIRCWYGACFPFWKNCTRQERRKS